jgi:hypothetical protein
MLYTHTLLQKFNINTATEFFKRQCRFVSAKVVTMQSTMITNWLTGTSPKPGISNKRKLDDRDVESEDDNVSSPNKRKGGFSKHLNQQSFDWYKKDEDGLWHCTLCRKAKMANAYSKGRPTTGKTTNHMRHSASK